MKVTDSRSMIATAMTEAELQAQVLDLAKLFGWSAYHTHDSRRSPGGFPDLVLVHASAGRLVFAELKRQKGRYEPGQEQWLEDLGNVGAAASRDLQRLATPNQLDVLGLRPRVEAHTWRPMDLLERTIEATLRVPPGRRA